MLLNWSNQPHSWTSIAGRVLSSGLSWTKKYWVVRLSFERLKMVNNIMGSWLMTKNSSWNWPPGKWMNRSRSTDMLPQLSIVYFVPNTWYLNLYRFCAFFVCSRLSSTEFMYVIDRPIIGRFFLQKWPPIWTALLITDNLFSDHP